MEGAMENWTNAKLCDVANLILGAFLFFSPWIFGFDGGKGLSERYHRRHRDRDSSDRSACGVCSLGRVAESDRRFVGPRFALGLGFHDATTATTVHIAVGVVVAILAAVELWMISQHPPRLTASHQSHLVLSASRTT
jgi:hypothetical protein